MLTSATLTGNLVVAEANLSKDIDQDTFAEGFRIANERKSEGEEIDMETKTLKSGCSTILVAALDPSLKGTNLIPSRFLPLGFLHIGAANADMCQIHLAPCFETAACMNPSRTTPRTRITQRVYGP